jgi:hypothetical protein
MNLPLVLDIAIGLIFIYLILSLLAAELQELLSTILQWRAVHLRKSIEILLTGGEDTPNADSVKGIVNELYNNPLIRNINQEAKAGTAGLLRQIVWQIGRIYRALRNKRTTSFGQELGQDRKMKDRRSAPSYIPSETFASTLLSRLNIATLTQKLSIINLINFKEQEIRVGIEKNIIDQLEISDETRSALRTELRKLEKNIDRIFVYFKDNKFTLLNSLNRIEEEFSKYIENSKDYFLDTEANSKKQFLEETASFKKDVFLTPEELITRLKPGLTEIADVLQKGNKAFEEIQDTIQDKNSAIYQAYEDIKIEIQGVIGQLPKSVRESLATLAMNAQMKAAKTDQELNQFKKEIEVWFDRSMDRASGVYKRNAKGVAFLMGLLLAFAANADTFHIISRLSKDTPLREVITRNAGQVATEESCQTFDTQDPSNSQLTDQVPYQSKLDCISDKVNYSLEQISLPIGRSLDNVLQQEDESKHWFFPPLRRFLGWMVSGIAISMGAPFWFELLGKIVNVRNTGPKPASSTEKQNSGN